MAKRSKTEPKLAVTINIDQSILADYEIMMQELRDSCECNQKHDIESQVEAMMRHQLIRHNADKLIRRYLGDSEA